MTNKTNGRVAIQISMSPATLQRLDAYVARLGVPRSTFVSMIIAQQLDSLEVMNNAIADKMAEMLKAQSELASK